MRIDIIFSWIFQSASVFRGKKEVGAKDQEKKANEDKSLSFTAVASCNQTRKPVSCYDPLFGYFLIYFETFIFPHVVSSFPPCLGCPPVYDCHLWLVFCLDSDYSHLCPSCLNSPCLPLCVWPLLYVVINHCEMVSVKSSACLSEVYIFLFFFCMGAGGSLLV